MNKSNRRNFIKKTGVAVGSLIATPTIIPASALGKNGFIAPSDRITMAVIGAGNQGGNDTRAFLQDERVQIVAVCDVNKKSDGYWNGKVAGREYVMDMVDKAYRERYGKRYRSTVGYEDFREVLQRKDIDTVEIATPDHWHAIPVMMAAATKKDIYCQKPLSLTVQEGRDMSNAVKHHNVVFQTGSQQRSNEHFRWEVEMVRSGKIGKLKKVTCGLPGGTPDFGKTAHLTDIAPVPANFDYDMWLGPAPEAPYQPCRTHVNFRWILDYSGGMLTDWGGHHPDIAQWAIGADGSGPVMIRNPKSKWSDHPIYNTATEFYFESVYENGVELIISNTGDNVDIPFGVRFHCEDGTVWASRKEHNAEPASIINIELEEKDRLYTSNNHYRNFIDCVISREQTAAPAEYAHRSITIAHLGNIAMMLNQDLEWDPVKEVVKDNFAANQLLSRNMRAPWNKVYLDYRV
jgi:predicted dehydrogenase